MEKYRKKEDDDAEGLDKVLNNKTNIHISYEDVMYSLYEANLT